jgi:hypothetical protein
MKKILYVLLGLLVVSCNQNSAAKKNKNQNVNKADTLTSSVIKSQPDKVIDTLIIGNKIYDLVSISESYFNSIKNQEKIINPGRSVIISHDSIIIKSIEKDVVLKNDTTDGDSMVTYNYITTLPEINYVHIKALCWEWTEDIFVNLNNGREYSFWDNPIVSPDNRLILSYCYDLEAQFMPNGLQLSNIVNDSIVTIFNKEISDWGPDDVKWESDTSIIIKRAIPDEKMNYTYDFVRMILTK